MLRHEIIRYPCHLARKYAPENGNTTWTDLILFGLLRITEVIDLSQITWTYKAYDRLHAACGAELFEGLIKKITSCEDVKKKTPSF